MHKDNASLPTLVICCIFDNNHSDRCEVISHMILNSTTANNVLQDIFHFIFIIFLKMLIDHYLFEWKNEVKIFYDRNFPDSSDNRI